MKVLEKIYCRYHCFVLIFKRYLVIPYNQSNYCDDMATKKWINIDSIDYVSYYIPHIILISNPLTESLGLFHWDILINNFYFRLQKKQLIQTSE